MTKTATLPSSLKTSEQLDVQSTEKVRNLIQKFMAVIPANYHEFGSHWSIENGPSIFALQSSLVEKKIVKFVLSNSQDHKAKAEARIILCGPNPFFEKENAISNQALILFGIITIDEGHCVERDIEFVASYTPSDLGIVYGIVYLAKILPPIL